MLARRAATLELASAHGFTLSTASVDGRGGVHWERGGRFGPGVFASPAAALDWMEDWLAAGGR